MRLILAVAVVVLLGVGVAAQAPVRPVPDALSWATASVTPALAVWRAYKSPDPVCQFSQLGVSGGIVAAGLLAQRFIVSPRPCVGSPGCSGNGMPSLHSAVGVIGLTSGWRVAIGFSVGTGILRTEHFANRHTKTQAAVGLGLGAFAEWAGSRLVRCPS